MFLIILALLGCESAEKKMDIQSVNSSNLVYRFESSSDEILYSYPKSDAYRKGDFEVKSLEIREMSDSYLLCIEIYNNFSNNFSLPGGWDLQVFDVYLFNQKGHHKHALKKRNVKFSESWEKAILISPLRLSTLKRELKEGHSDVYDDVSAIENLSNTFVADTVRVYENKIFVKLPKDIFEDTISRLEGVQVLVSNLDQFPTDNVSIKRVEEDATEWGFGNGSYSNNHPNVISILGDIQQLNSFSEEISRSVFAVVDPVKVKSKN